RVHVHNVQVCYICVPVPCCFGYSLDSSSNINSSFSSF
uniref:Uncharacterized protein n=1 Tax=Macaca fascicularis TaxID=9541 RepID=A0A7N9IDW6_MACFA